MLLLRFPVVTSVACMLMLNAMNVWSHAKTDEITASNGDRITGAMTEMTPGKLSVSTSYAGTSKQRAFYILAHRSVASGPCQRAS